MKISRFAMTEFFAPLSLAAVLVMAINDHLLKRQFHNALTGKLSDIAGCFFFPLFVSAVLGLVWRGARPVRIAIGGAVTVSLFTALELSPAADALFARGVGAIGAPFGLGRVLMTRDLTDLLALSLVPLGCWYGMRRGAAPSSGASDAGPHSVACPSPCRPFQVATEQRR